MGAGLSLERAGRSEGRNCGSTSLRRTATSTMAKYRHRIFEMYELRDEAIRALTPKSGKSATEVTAPESWTFAHLVVSRVAGVIQVQFKEPKTFDDTTANGLRDDLTHWPICWAGTARSCWISPAWLSFHASSISVLGQFKVNLQTKGSRIALCCLEPATRDSFFAVG